MMISKIHVVLGCLALALLVAGCGDHDRPKSLEQQADMAKGHQPTQEELNRAMSKFKAPGGAPQTPAQDQGTTR